MNNDNLGSKLLEIVKLRVNFKKLGLKNFKLGGKNPSDVHNLQFSSAQFSRSVVSDSLRLHGPQHTRPPCPSPTP